MDQKTLLKTVFKLIFKKQNKRLKVKVVKLFHCFDVRNFRLEALLRCRVYWSPRYRNGTYNILYTGPLITITAMRLVIIYRNPRIYRSLESYAISPMHGNVLIYFYMVPYRNVLIKNRPKIKKILLKYEKIREK